MTRYFVDADKNDLVCLWQEFFPERYWVDSELFVQNTTECSTFDWGASRIVYRNDKPVAMCGIKRSSSTLYHVANRDTYHLDFLAYTEPSAMADLLAEVRSLLVFRGGDQLRFGQSSRHFFPGCPLECSKLEEFLMIQGFEADGTVYDLERDLIDFEPTRVLPENFSARPLAETDLPELARFMEDNFPGRWAFDVNAKVRASGPGAIYGLHHGQELIGFAMIQTPQDQLPIGGAVWKWSLGDLWGALGPIGIAKSFRGRGFGGILLERALLELKHRGSRKTIIDWTDLDGFYKKVGFAITRTYRTYKLELP
jgi:ribosomal protein S18 acetylase RimI-like enzyme